MLQRDPKRCGGACMPASQTASVAWPGSCCLVGATCCSRTRVSYGKGEKLTAAGNYQVWAAENQYI